MKLKSIFFYLIKIFLLINCSNIFAQNKEGSLVIFPVSQFSHNKNEEKLNIVNTSNETKKFLYEVSCNINNVKYIDNKCNEYFDFNINDILEKNIIKIPANTQLEKTITLKKTPKDDSPFYAIFTPIFTILPADYEDNKKSFVAFEFKYAPGALFIWNAVNKELTLDKFSITKESNGIRVINFNFDISKIEQAQVITINAKITDKSTKKIIRFLDLGKEKIVDPQRKLFTRSAELDKGNGGEDTICYELFIQNILTNNAYKISSKNCN